MTTNTTLLECVEVATGPAPTASVVWMHGLGADGYDFVPIVKELDVNTLPGQPKAIKETLEGLKDADGKSLASGIFAAVPYCIDLIGGPYIETDETVCKAFRPKTAVRARDTLPLKAKLA